MINSNVEWGLCALRHGIQLSMEAILACHPARSTDWLDCHPKSCELWRIRTGPIHDFFEAHCRRHGKHLEIPGLKPYGTHLLSQLRSLHFPRVLLWLMNVQVDARSGTDLVKSMNSVQNLSSLTSAWLGHFSRTKKRDLSWDPNSSSIRSMRTEVRAWRWGIPSIRILSSTCWRQQEENAFSVNEAPNETNVHKIGNLIRITRGSKDSPCQPQALPSCRRPVGCVVGKRWPGTGWPAVALRHEHYLVKSFSNSSLSSAFHKHAIEHKH